MTAEARDMRAETPGAPPRPGRADMHIHTIVSDGTASAESEVSAPRPAIAERYLDILDRLAAER